MKNKKSKQKETKNNEPLETIVFKTPTPKADAVEYLNKKGYRAALEGGVPIIYTDREFEPGRADQKKGKQASGFLLEIRDILEKSGYAGSVGIRYGTNKDVIS